jgi:CheY-like chemotaxis protein
MAIILVVDDEKDVREGIAGLLELEDFTVLQACSGNEAIKLIESNKDIRIILSDVRMPNGDGIAILDYLQTQPKESAPKIILISGQTDLNRTDAIAKGALELFVKPPNIDQLLNFIKLNVKN